MDHRPQKFGDSSEEMLSDHSKRRDRHGIPVVKNTTRIGFVEDFEKEGHKKQRWNHVHKTLRSIVADVRDLQGRIEFSQTWLLRKLNPIKRPSTPQSTDLTINASNDISVKSEIAALKNRKPDLVVHLKEISMAMGILLRHALIDLPDIFPGSPNIFPPLRTFIRFWNHDFHTKYDDSLGFRCSNWMECEPANNFMELKDRGALTTQGLRDHCQKTPIPSCWISLCANASWTLKHMGKECYVAIISVPNMDRLNILWQQSDTLVREARGETYGATHEDRVKFAWPGHYLVYGWIPAQCVIQKYTAQRFQQLCKERSIKAARYLYINHWYLNS
jgi:hypothetical protein